jgi:hypothetical protein
MKRMKQLLMTMALLMCAVTTNAQTANVTDRDLIGVWTLKWMQYDGEKKIMCGKTTGYTQFKYYGPDGEYAAAGIVLSTEGKIVVIPQEYGTYSLKNGWYMEMGRPALKDAVILTDKTHYRGRWKNRSDSWVKQPNIPEKVVRYIVERCKTKDTPADVSQSIKQNMFK